MDIVMLINEGVLPGFGRDLHSAIGSTVRDRLPKVFRFVWWGHCHQEDNTRRVLVLESD